MTANPRSAHARNRRGNRRGIRSGWLARLTRGRLGLGRWTQTEIDRINTSATEQSEAFRTYTD